MPIAPSTRHAVDVAAVLALVVVEEAPMRLVAPAVRADDLRMSISPASPAAITSTLFGAGPRRAG
jgi:hypothetical protein